MDLKELTKSMRNVVYTEGGDIFRPSASRIATINEHYLTGPHNGKVAYELIIYQYTKPEGDYLFELTAQVRGMDEVIANVSITVTTTAEVYAATQTVFNLWDKCGRKPLH